jgi:hypothetical protein
MSLNGTIKGSPVADSDPNEGALYSFDADSTAYNPSIWVPAAAQSKFVGQAVDTSDTDVSAFVIAVTGAHSSVSASDRYANDITALRSAVKKFRRK